MTMACVVSQGEEHSEQSDRGAYSLLKLRLSVCLSYLYWAEPVIAMYSWDVFIYNWLDSNHFTFEVKSRCVYVFMFINLICILGVIVETGSRWLSIKLYFYGFI